MHKIHLKPEYDLAAFDALVATLPLPEQVQTLTFAPRADALRADWDAMTDKHQSFSMTNRHKMNRLGAYHTIGAPHLEQLDVAVVTQTLTTCAAMVIPVVIFVGNAGCIQIHGGLIEKNRAYGAVEQRHRPALQPASAHRSHCRGLLPDQAHPARNRPQC